MKAKALQFAFCLLAMLSISVLLVDGWFALLFLLPFSFFQFMISLAEISNLVLTVIFRIGDWLAIR